MFGKNAFTGGGKRAAAQIADLVVVFIYVRYSSVSTYKLAAKCASVGTSVREGMTNVVKLGLAVFARRRAGIQTHVSTVGIHCAADVAGGRTSVCKIMSKAGALAANCTNATALFGRCGMELLNGSLLAAFIAGGIARAIVSMSYGLAGDLKCLKAVLANGAADGLGSVSDCIARIFTNRTFAGGATFYVAGGIASSRVGVSTNCLAAALNHADSVTIQRIVVVADVLADRIADVADEVSIRINVCNRLGGAASRAGQCVAEAFPYVLFGSLVATTVVTDLVTSIGIKVLVVSSYKTTGTAGGATSELKVVHICGNKTGATAMNAGNGAAVSIFMACFTGCITEGANGGAGVEPCVCKLALGSLLATYVTIDVTGVGIGVNHAGSLFAANAAGNRATFFVGVLQIRTCRRTNVADRITAARVGVLNGADFSVANIANRAVASKTFVLSFGLSFNRGGAAITERIAIGRILVIYGAEAGCEREKRDSHSQK